MEDIDLNTTLLPRQNTSFHPNIKKKKSYLEVSFPQQFLYLSYKYAEYRDTNNFF